MITDIKDIGKCIEGESGFFNTDCMDGMRKFPDEYFDLAIVDPPYGGGNAEKTGGTARYGSGDGSTGTSLQPIWRTVRPIQVTHAYGGRFKRYNTAPPRRGVPLA